MYKQDANELAGKDATPYLSLLIIYTKIPKFIVSEASYLTNKGNALANLFRDPLSVFRPEFMMLVIIESIVM